jgi:hypothetical protein
MLPVLIAFAGVLVVAVAIGTLAGRYAREPRPCLLVWTVAAFGLLVALAAAGVGMATGFGPSALLAVRLGVRLIAGFALALVAGLILAAAALSAARFSTAWPLASQAWARAWREPEWTPAVAGVGALGLAVLLTVTWRLSPSARSSAGSGVGCGAHLVRGHKGSGNCG